MPVAYYEDPVTQQIRSTTAIDPKARPGISPSLKQLPTPIGASQSVGYYYDETGQVYTKPETQAGGFTKVEGFKVQPGSAGVPSTEGFYYDLDDPSKVFTKKETSADPLVRTKDELRLKEGSIRANVNESYFRQQERRKAQAETVQISKVQQLTGAGLYVQRGEKLSKALPFGLNLGAGSFYVKADGKYKRVSQAPYAELFTQAGKGTIAFAKQEIAFQERAGLKPRERTPKFLKDIKISEREASKFIGVFYAATFFEPAISRGAAKKGKAKAKQKTVQVKKTKAPPKKITEEELYKIETELKRSKSYQREVTKRILELKKTSPKEAKKYEKLLENVLGKDRTAEVFQDVKIQEGYIIPKGIARTKIITTPQKSEVIGALPVKIQEINKAIAGASAFKAKKKVKKEDTMITGGAILWGFGTRPKSDVKIDVLPKQDFKTTPDTNLSFAIAGAAASGIKTEQKAKQDTKVKTAVLSLSGLKSATQQQPVFAQPLAFRSSFASGITSGRFSRQRTPRLIPLPDINFNLEFRTPKGKQPRASRVIAPRRQYTPTLVGIESGLKRKKKPSKKRFFSGFEVRLPIKKKGRLPLL